MLGLRKLPVPSNRVAMLSSDNPEEDEDNDVMPRIGGMDKTMDRTFSHLTYGPDLLGDSYAKDYQCVCDMLHYISCRARNHRYPVTVENEDGDEGEDMPMPKKEKKAKVLKPPFSWEVMVGLVLLDFHGTEEDICAKISLEYPEFDRVPEGRNQKRVGWEGAVRAAMRESDRLEKVGKTDKFLGKPASSNGWVDCDNDMWSIKEESKGFFENYQVLREEKKNKLKHASGSRKKKSLESTPDEEDGRESKRSKVLGQKITDFYRK